MNIEKMNQTAGITQETECCLNCKHFYQHYVKDDTFWKGYAVPLYMGHCCYPRLKHRRCNDVCENFKRKEE